MTLNSAVVLAAGDRDPATFAALALFGGAVLEWSRVDTGFSTITAAVIERLAGACGLIVVDEDPDLGGSCAWLTDGTRAMIERIGVDELVNDEG